MKNIFKAEHFFSLRVKSLNKKIGYLLFAFAVTMIWLATGLAINYSGMKMFIVNTCQNLFTISLFPFIKKIRSRFDDVHKIHLWHHHH